MKLKYLINYLKSNQIIQFAKIRERRDARKNGWEQTRRLILEWSRINKICTFLAEFVSQHDSDVAFTFFSIFPNWTANFT